MKRYSNRKKRMIKQKIAGLILMLIGEIPSIIFKDITTGASSDIKKATKEARMMVTRFGMSENIGVICYDDDDDEVFIGRDFGHTRGYSESVAKTIDEEVKKIVDKAYNRARDILSEHVDKLHAVAGVLHEKKKIEGPEFDKIFEE